MSGEGLASGESTSLSELEQQNVPGASWRRPIDTLCAARPGTLKMKSAPTPPPPPPGVSSRNSKIRVAHTLASLRGGVAGPRRRNGAAGDSGAQHVTAEL
jgi:hypothetical protein